MSPVFAPSTPENISSHYRRSLGLFQLKLDQDPSSDGPKHLGSTSITSEPRIFRAPAIVATSIRITPQTTEYPNC